ncbi:MAG: type II toxin-antitoxin system VapC family toxin [Verrucomicrobia bacterium]|nr:type II toxin-antitoxin system VapC family toxin [Verrucomicrobiota bacterium]
MGTMKAVFDTNILIDYLNGHPIAVKTLAGYDDKIISRITWIEVLVGTANSAEETVARQFLARFRIVETRDDIAEHAIFLRRTAGAGRKLKLPDAVIYASAKAENCSLVTRNTKDFDPTQLQDVVVPYNLPVPS